MEQREFTEIGTWSETKLEIIRKYAQAYTTILSKHPEIKRYVYVDGFAGQGVHISKTTGNFVLGSPLNALLVIPPFHEYHLVDLNAQHAFTLREITQGFPNVFVYDEDCNLVLPSRVFPRMRYEDFARGLCLLDPYGLHLNWEVIHQAGQMKTIEVFINFPTMDINRNVLTRDKRVVDPRFAEDPTRAAKMANRMTAFWGDESWKEVGYSGQQAELFGGFEKASNDVLAAAFQARLKNIAGFEFVPDPVAMQDMNRTLYYLFFASPNAAGSKIVEDIFKKYRASGSGSS